MGVYDVGIMCPYSLSGFKFTVEGSMPEARSHCLDPQSYPHRIDLSIHWVRSPPTNRGIPGLLWSRLVVGDAT